MPGGRAIKEGTGWGCTQAWDQTAGAVKGVGGVISVRSVFNTYVINYCTNRPGILFGFVTPLCW